MSRAILMSDRPKWVAEILSGKKIIEIRKTWPKCELPIDGYIYCTKGDYIGYLSNKYIGKVVAKFTLRKIEKLEDVAEFYLDGDADCEFKTESLPPWELYEKSGLTRWELEDYIGEGEAYAWYISNLVIFDKPKELSEFRYKKVTQKWDKNYHYRIVKKEIVPVNRPPQSWQYMEVEE